MANYHIYIWVKKFYSKSLKEGLANLCKTGSQFFPKKYLGNNDTLNIFYNLKIIKLKFGTNYGTNGRRKHY